MLNCDLSRCRPSLWEYVTYSMIHGITLLGVGQRVVSGLKGASCVWCYGLGCRHVVKGWGSGPQVRASDAPVPAVTVRF